MTNSEAVHGVPDESKIKYHPLTTIELKRRLKHIAGLCYALACDITNSEIEAEYLRMENEYLRNRLEQKGIKPPKAKSFSHMAQYVKRMRQTEGDE